MLHVDGAIAGAAWRRRERRLMMHWGHEQLTLQMALAAAHHHSRDGGRVTHFGPQAQETARAGGAAGTEYYVMSDHDELPAAERCGLPVWLSRGGRQDVDAPSLGVPALHRGEEEDRSALLAAVLTEPQKVTVQEIPDVGFPLLFSRVLQPRDVEQILLYPALRTIAREDGQD